MVIFLTLTILFVLYVYTEHKNNNQYNSHIEQAEVFLTSALKSAKVAYAQLLRKFRQLKF